MWTVVVCAVVHSKAAGRLELEDVPAELEHSSNAQTPITDTAFLNTCVTHLAGTAIVVATAVLSLALGVLSGSPALLATLAGSLVLGVLYSTGVFWLVFQKRVCAFVGVFGC